MQFPINFELLVGLCIILRNLEQLLFQHVFLGEIKKCSKPWCIITRQKLMRDYMHRRIHL